MISKEIKNTIEEITGYGIKDIRNVTGGCISSAFKITLASGENVFLKLNPECCNEMFLKEANGLRELRKAGSIRVPEVKGADRTFILLENIESSQPKLNFFKEFGVRFADMHKLKSSSFGFYENNFIGSNHQINIPENGEADNWVEFYFRKRILYQFKLAEINGNSTDDLRRVISQLEGKIESILKGSEEPPSLLHGDLWSGNYVIDEEGSACLIDPAVYYGHRESDIAMTRLFGGFSSDFYEAYNEAYPLPEGFERRENIYNLYHALNHLNLFGNGYYNKTLTLAKYYL